MNSCIYVCIWTSHKQMKSYPRVYTILPLKAAHKPGFLSVRSAWAECEIQPVTHKAREAEFQPWGLQQSQQ